MDHNLNNPSGAVANPVPTTTPSGSGGSTPPAGTPGTSVPSTGDPDLDKAVGLVVEARTTVAGQLLPPLPKGEGKKMVKPRLKALAAAEKVLEFAVANPKLTPEGVDPGKALSEIEQAKKQAVLHSVLVTTASLVGGSVLQLNSDAWKAVLAIYALMGADKGNAQAMLIVGELKDAMSTGKRPENQKHLVPGAKPKGGKKAASPASAPAPVAAPAETAPAPNVVVNAAGGGNGNSRK